MKIFRVGVSGFGAYEGKKVWNVENGLTIVSGRNGAGKSTLYVESIAWALYGDTFKGIKAGDVVNDQMDKCMVKLETDIGIIKRVKSGDSGSRVYVNDVVVTDNKIVSLVGLDRKMFFNSVVFGNGVSGFLYLSGGDRKQMLNMAFEDIDNMVEKLKQNKVVVQGSKNEIENRINILQREVDDYIEKLKLYEGRVSDDKLKDVKRRIAEIENELDNLKRKIDVKLNKVNKDIDNKTDRMKLNELKEIERDLLMKKTRMIEKLRIEQNKYEELSEYDKCPKCERVIDSKYKKILKKELESVEQGIRKEIKGVEIKLEDVVNKMQVIVNKLEDVEKNREKLINEINELRKDESRGRDVLRNLNNELRECEKIQSEYDRIKKEILVRKKMIESDKNSLLEKSIYADGHDFWIRKLADYKMMLFKELIENFEPVANRFLSVLSNGRFSIRFNAGVKGQKRISETYNIEVCDKNRGVDFNRLSNGEKRMITLGVNMCFQYLMTKYFAQDWNLVVFDEVFDGLDRVVRERVVDLLLDFVEEMNKSVIVITHDEFSYRAEEWKAVNI
jgi:DNA repair exonuclease SbcCD ATPase subunit